MNYLKLLNFEQIIFLKKKMAYFESMPVHFDKTRSIYIHIPKAAGTSLVKTLYDTEITNHDTWLEYYRRDKEKFNNYFKFTIVREPIARFISAYKYLSEGGKADIDKYWFEKYLSEYKDINDFIINGGLRFAYEHVEHFIPQVNFVCKKDHIIVDYVAKYETLSADFNFIKQRLDSTSNLQLKSINVTKNKKAQLLNDESLEYLVSIYHDDFKTFNYEFPSMKS
jgi:hypothetical protein